MKYEEHILLQFVLTQGDNSLKYIDEETIEKQRKIIKHVLKEIGTNILSGSGIMNVSLPINIFDHRSLLEVFAHQCRLAPHILELAGMQKDPVEKLKYTTAYTVSRLHLSVTQLKPFNPILGETFQAKIGDTLLYIEQTSHHPPIYNFYHTGKNFKCYGYQQPTASTGANSIYTKTLGTYFVEFSDGTIHKIIPAPFSIGGTLIGGRTISTQDRFYVVDEGNDLISYNECNPDERGTLSKLFFKKNKTFPDYFK
jgi:hypothetical protein